MLLILLLPVLLFPRLQESHSLTQLYWQLNGLFMGDCTTGAGGMVSARQVKAEQAMSLSAEAKPYEQQAGPFGQSLFSSV